MMGSLTYLLLIKIQLLANVYKNGYIHAHT